MDTPTQNVWKDATLQTRRRIRFLQGVCAGLLLLGLTADAVFVQQATSSASVAQISQQFLAPQDYARPMVRWWWFGPAVEKPEIFRELQQMKADGIGGVELAFVYPEALDDPAKGIHNLTFLSPAMLDAVTYAKDEARKLGLRVDVTLCSGWPYGGPATTLAEAAHRLRTVEVSIPAGSTAVTPPKLGEGETLLSTALARGTPKQWDAATATPLPDALPPADTPRVALFFVESPTRQQVKRAAVGAEGFVLDPFSQQAVATHLHAVGEPLLRAFGDTPPYAIFSDSLEAYGADWTPTLPAEFQRRRGYDLLPRLPELVAGTTPAAANLRHDYGRTLTELVNQNYLTQIDTWATTHHTRFRSQTYGEPAVSFSSQRLATLAEGEGPQWRAFSTLRWATSANHVFGNPITSGETFTWLHSPVFRATPLDMKAEADIDFLMGENQLIFHGWPYSPPAAALPPGDPGWSLYAAAVFNDHNPWHPVMPAVTAYITRVSALLRQGEPANQVALLLPTDDAWANFAPGHVTVTGAMQRLVPKEIVAAILSAGYNLDFIDAEAINTVGLGTHQILVLPPTDRIPLETLKKIAAFTARGGKVVAVGRAPSLDAEGNSNPEVVALSHRLFNQNVANEITLIPDVTHMKPVLHLAARPDFLLSSTACRTCDVSVGNLQAMETNFGFIRRKLPNADIYFVANTSNQPLSAYVGFATSFRSGLRLNPETGFTSQPTPWIYANSLIHLAPYESALYVFSDFSAGDIPPHPKTDPDALIETDDLSTAWKVTFTGTGKSIAEPTLADWTANPGTIHYSGEAVYTRDFKIYTLPVVPVYLQIDGGKPLPGAPGIMPEQPALGPDGLPNPRITRTGPGMHAFYDPPIREAALVTINGRPAGALWHPPYRLEVSSLLKQGQNHIEIHVYNTALNAWSALPPHDYKPLIAKYGDRFQMQDLDQVRPLPSGILGTIRLITEETK